jgi:hypothetical protein
MPVQGKLLAKKPSIQGVPHMTNVWVYHGKVLKVFASAEAAQKWFDVNDPEGVAFMCEVEGEEQLEPVPSIAPGC